jgi:hypothetical protein
LILRLCGGPDIAHALQGLRFLAKTDIILPMDTGWNLFLDIPAEPNQRLPGGWRPPGRVYARVESVESDLKSRPLWIRLDGVDADWFEATLEERMDAESYFRSMPLVAIEFDPNALRTIPEMRPLLEAEGNDVDDIISDDPEFWIELELGASGFSCEVYGNLGAEPVVAMAKAKFPSPKSISALRKTFDLANFFSPASNSTIQSSLNSVGIPDGVVVYDVGQGSAAGVVDPQCRPLLYLDVGGGVTRNIRSFPVGLTHFCNCTNAPIVLSHWDWDHWASAGRGQNMSLRTHTWIAPMQKGVGPTHLAFAQAIHQMGTLHLWARGNQPPIKNGAVTLERCTGSGRNHSGIAVIINGPPGTNPVLFPGDARYNVIPSGRSRYDSLVVPHHGADMSYRWTPTSPAAPHSRAVYSYGPGNTFTGGNGTISHPAFVTRSDHDVNGWSDSKISAVTPGQVRQTEDRAGLANVGHVYVGWSHRPSLPPLACAGFTRCSLEPTQN